jgi:hypothetical protein
MEDTLFRGNREPTLDQILAEPIVQTIMRRDGVDAETVRRLMRPAIRGASPATAARPKLNFVPPTPPPRAVSDSPHTSIGVIAQAANAPQWPRVFPSL